MNGAMSGGQGAGPHTARAGAQDAAAPVPEATFSQALGALAPAPGGWRAPVPANWAQGRTAYGGFTAALLLAAARAGRADLPPLRSALVNFTAPLGAAPLLAPNLLRRGRNVTTIEVRALLDEAVAAQGVFSFGAAQDSHIAQECPAPDAPAPEEAAPLFPPGSAPPVRFFENFELRRIAGELPFSGAGRGLMRVWARHRDPAARGRIEGLIGIADVLPPAVFPRMRRPGANSSMTWICNFLCESCESRDGWWMIESALSAARDGYSSQVMRAWNTRGELVVEGMQSVLVFA